MTIRQLDCCPNFSASEIKKAGGNLKKIKFISMMILQAFRTAIDRRVKFQYNGITEGNHYSEEHPAGEAFDIRFDKRDGIITWRNVKWFIKIALRVGFRGIGVYWNGKEYSMHLDTRPDFSGWKAKKQKGKRKWIYSDLLSDPRGK